MYCVCCIIFCVKGFTVGKTTSKQRKSNKVNETHFASKLIACHLLELRDGKEYSDGLSLVALDGGVNLVYICIK